jgi:biotin-dependent carboxylase-like uncharacterized protein
VSSFDVIDAGLFTTVQDLGRRGWGHYGVGRSGAADRGSLRLGNRLVGNAETAAGLEILAAAAAFRVSAATVVAITGARSAVLVNDRPEARNVAVQLAPGDVLRLGAAARGLRSYLAVRGGIDIPPVLGSRSYDQLGGLGPPPLRVGDTVPIGAEPDRAPYREVVPVREIQPEPTLRVLAGPRDDWLRPPGIGQLTGEAWTVLPMSDRTGLRLEGPRIGRRDGELASEGLVPGAVQLPADGAPIVLGPDAGATGGYPVVAVVIDADRDLLGQLAPGARVRFRLLS